VKIWGIFGKRLLDMEVFLSVKGITITLLLFHLYKESVVPI